MADGSEAGRMDEALKQRMAAHLKADQARLVEQGVLPPDIVRRAVKGSEKETPEQRERRRAALEKLRSFLD